MSIPDETLMAFADGTLPPAEAERVAAAVEADPALAERVALLADGRRIAAGAFRDVLDEPVPARLLAAAGAAPAAPAMPRAANDNPRRGWRVTALAAAAGLLAGAFLGNWLPRSGGMPGPDGLLPARVAAALEGGQAAGVAVAGTHATEGGVYCRRFALQDGPGTVQGLACREPAGWRLRVAVARGAAGTGFQPASGEDPVIAEVLERLGAGPALDAAAEAQAQRQGWRPR
jgi:anti-sigma factor RsiW